MNNKVPWAIAAIAVVAMAVMQFRSNGTGTQPAASEPGLQQVMARLDALEQRSAVTRRPDGALGGAGPSTPSRLAAIDAMQGKNRSPEEMAAEQARQHRELEAAFARDAADPVGGGKVENVLEQTVTGETMTTTGLQPDDVQIQCKRSSCRTVGSFAKRGDAEDWGLFYITAAGGNVLSNTQMVYVPQPDGSVQVRIYSRRASNKGA